MKRYEIDLFKPIQDYFIERGYEVHGEVNDCDVTASTGNELIIIELKLSLTIDLLVQATKRQRLTELVYIAIPKPTYSLRSKKWKDTCHLMRRLELGLLTVSFQEDNITTELILEPQSFDRIKSMRQSKKGRSKILNEIKGRQANYNIGGSHQKKLMTAYKENCIYIACCLERFGPLSPKLLREMGTGVKTASILQENYYGWFDRSKRGIYVITEKGLAEFNEIPQISDSYYKRISNQKISD